MKKILIVANWKMNPATAKEANDLASAIARKIFVQDLPNMEVVLCPPFVYIPTLLYESEVRQSSEIQVGAQDCFWEQKGAFTGEISPLMLKHLGCSYVILGHSERKHYVRESVDMINKKIKTALRVKLTPIVCIGEEEKDKTKNSERVAVQMQEVLNGITESDIKNIVLVYEPEWAISSNVNAIPATPENAKQSIGYMRQILDQLFGGKGKETRILYGGSVSSTNIRSFIQESGADGALVGASSLEAGEFVALVKNAAIS